MFTSTYVCSLPPTCVHYSQKYITNGQIVQFSVSFVLSLPFMYFQLTSSCFGLHAFVFSMVCNGIFLVLFIRFRESAYPQKVATADVGKADVFRAKTL